MPRLLRGTLGALLATLVVLGTLWPADRVQALSTFDQPFYLGIAQDLHDTGRFTDGYMFADALRDGTRPSGMRFAPLYPSLLAAVATLDSRLRAAMACQVRTQGHDPSCPRAAPLMRWLQFAMLAAFFVLLWQGSRLASGSQRIAWLSLLLAAPTAGVLLRSVDTLMTEITALLLITACLTSALAAWRVAGSRHRRLDRALAWTATSGVLLGLSILTRPVFLYLFYATSLTALAMIAARAIATRARGDVTPAPAVGPGPPPPETPWLHVPAAWRRPTSPATLDAARPVTTRQAVLALVAFVLAVGLPIAPWIARNAVVVGHAELTHGYDSHTLVQRISFDSMTWREYGLSFVCWLPDGSGIGDALFGRHACDRFGYDERPDTFYSVGMNQLMAQTLAASGGWDRHLSYLLTHYILREPLWHLAVTLPLALRGMWIDHYWGLLLGPACAVLTLQAAPSIWHSPGWPLSRSGTGLRPARTARLQSDQVGGLWYTRRSRQGLLLLALPAWFVLAFNAAVAVNQARYNLMLIPAYALSGALLIDMLLGRFRGAAAVHARDIDTLTSDQAVPDDRLGARRTTPLRTLRTLSIDAARALAGLPRPSRLSSAAPEAPQPVFVPWQHPPLAGRERGSARSNAARRRRDPPAD